MIERRREVLCDETVFLKDEDLLVLKGRFEVKRRVLISFMLAVFVACSAAVAEPVPPTPEEHFGFRPGSDRMLISYEELIGYLQALDDESPALKLVEIGESPMGRKIYICFISSGENIADLDSLIRINRALALDPSIEDGKREKMIAGGKVFFTATLSMHSSEVGPSQSAPIIAHMLLAGGERVDEWMDNVVYMMVPCHNPDGMDMIVEHYRKYKGTKYETTSMPGLYHKYVGHDNNRDFINITQSDTRAISFIFSRDYFPQVMVEKHQMGSRGVRFFVPPNHDPIAMNVDAGIWNWSGIFGANMIKDMTQKGLAGVAQHYLFDDYWPGSTETCIWKNVIGFLTEAASARHATPVYVEPNELGVYGKGLSEYEKSTNMPLPWDGGLWRLSDIVDYEIVSTMSIIKTCSLHRSDILRFRNDMCRKEVARGKNEPPYYYILPARQRDASAMADLVNLLLDHGLDAYTLDSRTVIKDVVYEEGSIVVPLAQPFRPMVKELMERQRYPVRHYTPEGEVIKPYDITSWSLPLNRGVDCREIDTRSASLESSISKITAPFSFEYEWPGEVEGILLPASNNHSYMAAFEAEKAGIDVWRIDKDYAGPAGNASEGSFCVKGEAARSGEFRKILGEKAVIPLFLKEAEKISGKRLEIPRIGLVESWFHDMDAGWTRFILESYSIPFKVLRPGDFKDLKIGDKFDILILPDTDKSVLVNGKRKRGESEYDIPAYPPEYREGMGEKGLEKIIKFIDEGGAVVSWGRSTDLFTGILKIERGKDDAEEFKLPFDNISERVKVKGFFCPGATMRLKLAQGHPVTYGMSPEIGAMYRGSALFTTTVPAFDMDRSVIGKFPQRDILMSGYCEKEELLAKKTALVWLRKGKGQLVLFAFNPQFRASTEATYKLLFNSILLPGDL